MTAKQYDHLFTWDIHYQNTYPPQKAMMFYGLNDEKNHFQIRFTHVSVPFEGKEPPHKHDFDEVFCFVPCSDDLTDFDGECELHLGDNGEKYIINKPCTVHVPAGLMHCPIRHTRVGLPYFFVNCVLSGEYSRPEDGRGPSKGMGLPRYNKKSKERPNGCLRGNRYDHFPRHCGTVHSGKDFITQFGFKIASCRVTQENPRYQIGLLSCFTTGDYIGHLLRGMG